MAYGAKPFSSQVSFNAAPQRSSGYSALRSRTSMPNAVAPRLSADQLAAFDPTAGTEVTQEHDVNNAFATPFNAAAQQARQGISPEIMSARMSSPEPPGLSPFEPEEKSFAINDAGAFATPFKRAAEFAGPESTKSPDAMGSTSFNENLLKGIDVSTKTAAPKLQGGDLVRGSQSDLEKAEKEWQEATDSSGSTWAMILSAMFPQFGAVLNMRNDLKERKMRAAQNKYDAAYWSVFSPEMTDREKADYQEELLNRRFKAQEEATDARLNKQFALQQEADRNNPRNAITYINPKTYQTTKVRPGDSAPDGMIEFDVWKEQMDINARKAGINKGDDDIKSYTSKDGVWYGLTRSGRTVPIEGVPLEAQVAESALEDRNVRRAGMIENRVVGSLVSGVVPRTTGGSLIDRFAAEKLKARNPKTYADAITILTEDGKMTKDSAIELIRNMALPLFRSGRLSEEYLTLPQVDVGPTASHPSAAAPGGGGGSGIPVYGLNGKRK